eukprot:Lithocolla_globosa_v1_NODE_1679_length_2402_cov_28.696634.p2 type:complete len:159 gc:universal NODE_1679_length_2402_cov_28.696634:1458-1934(+)
MTRFLSSLIVPSRRSVIPWGHVVVWNLQVQGLLLVETSVVMGSGKSLMVKIVIVVTTRHAQETLVVILIVLSKVMQNVVILIQPVVIIVKSLLPLLLVTLFAEPFLKVTSVMLPNIVSLEILYVLMMPLKKTVLTVQEKDFLNPIALLVSVQIENNNV